MKLSHFCIFWTLWRAVVAIAAWCLVHQKMHYGRVKSRASLNSFIFIQSLLMVFVLHSRSFPKRVTEAFEWLNLTASAWFHHVPPLLCTPHMNTANPMMINWACWAGTNMYERHHSCIGLTEKEQWQMTGEDSKSKQKRFNRFVFLSAFSPAHSGPKHNLSSNIQEGRGQNRQPLWSLSLRICECATRPA